MRSQSRLIAAPAAAIKYARRDWRRKRRLRTFTEVPVRDKRRQRRRIYQLRLAPAALSTWAVIVLHLYAPQYRVAVNVSCSVGVLGCLLWVYLARRMRQRNLDPHRLLAQHEDQTGTGPTNWHGGNIGCVPLTPRRTGPMVVATTLIMMQSAALAAGLVISAAVQQRDAGLSDLLAAQAVAEVSGRILATPKIIASATFGASGTPERESDAATTHMTQKPATRTPPTSTRYLVLLEVSQVTARGSTRTVATNITALGEVGGLHKLGPGTHVTLVGRLAPPMRPDATSATLKVTRVRSVVPPAGVHALTDTLRTQLRAATHDFEPAVRGLINGVTFGDTRDMPSAALDDMKIAGLTHLTAVSGGNLAIVALCATYAMRLVRWRRQVRIAVILAAVGLYVVAVGFEASVVRAAAMATLMYVALWLGRPRAALALLCAAILILLWFSPFLAVNIGFALSVVATGAIVGAAVPCSQQWSRVTRAPPWLTLPFSVSTVAQLACTPLLVLIGGGVSTYAVLANVVVAPLIAPLTIIGLAVSCMAWLSPEVAAVVAWCAAGLAHAVLLVSEWTAALPWALLPWPQGASGVLYLIGVTMVLSVLTVFAHKHLVWWVLAWVSVAAALLLSAFTVVPKVLPRVPAAPWVFAQCDVGQGDALLVATGVPGHAVLIDVGPEPELVSRCIREAGVTHLDYVVLTHAHADHIGGLAGALDAAAVARVVVPPSESTGESTSSTQPADTPQGQLGAEWQAVSQALAAHHVVPEVLTAGSHIAAGEFTATVVGPVDEVSVRRVAAQETGGSEGSWANDSSLVLIGNSGQVSFAALGDLEPAAQRELVRRVRLGPVDVVKVAHHGSPRQAQELYAALRPKVALVSVGAGNSYGHPGTKTIDLLTQMGTIILRTDVEGPVMMGASDNVLVRTPFEAPKTE